MELTPERIILIGSLVVGVFCAITRSRKISQPEPSLQQWVNRLIEHFEGDYLDHAFRTFSYLIQSGLEPEHAFEITIRS